MSEKETQSGIHVKLTGKDGNIFNLMGIVLIGIAVGPDGKIYVTGKYWKKLFEITIKEK